VKGNERVIDALNARLIDELTSRQQYYAHVAYYRNLGLTGLAEVAEEHIADEEKHANRLTDHIAFLEGTPAVGQVNSIARESSVPQMLEADRLTEYIGIGSYNATAALCVEVGDFITLEIILQILKDERDHIDDQEKALGEITLMGEQNYLSQQIG